MHVCVLQPHSDLRLSVRARRVLHHHGVVLMEGDRHHAGELPAPLHPQVPAQTFLPAQLLQADLLNTERSLRPHLLLENRKDVLVFILRSLRLHQRVKHGFIPVTLF